MAGFGASYRLNAEGFRPVVYDKNSYFGGHTASFRDDQGFLFDLGPHISFTKDARIQDLFAGYVEQKYESVQINLNNYWRGIRITHPVQLHLNALPKDLIVEIIADFVKEHDRAQDRQLRRLADRQLRSQVCRTVSDDVHAQVPPDGRIEHEHRLARRTHVPAEPRTAAARRAGSLDARVALHHELSLPHRRRFQFVPAGPAQHRRYQLEHELVAIDPKRKTLTFSNGFTRPYDALVSSVALTDLIPMIAGAPPDVVAASQRLACSTCVLVNVGVDRADLSQSQMTYFYDEDICFSRISFPTCCRLQRTAGLWKYSGGGLLLQQIPSSDAGA